jgi:RimJ/RimL family protein N-acetyltransferase
MELTTERLVIKPFDLAIIDAASEKDPGKIESLGYKVNNEWPEPDLFEVLPHFRQLIIEHGINGYGSWLILEKNTKEIIGSIGFTGNPDEYGNVEIGFGIIPSRRRKGYCLESATSLIEWAFKQENISCIKAQCDERNTVSSSILAQLGFLRITCAGNLINWEMKRNKQPSACRHDGS